MFSRNPNSQFWKNHFLCLWSKNLNNNNNITQKLSLQKSVIFLDVLMVLPTIRLQRTCHSRTVPCWEGLVVSVSACHAIGHGFAPSRVTPKTIKMVQTASLLGMHGQDCDRAARLSEMSGGVWNCLWGHALKISPGINGRSRVLYPGPGFLSSTTWPSMPEKHYNIT